MMDVTAFEQCIAAVCQPASTCVVFPYRESQRENWVSPLNLFSTVVPLAVIRPSTAEEVAKAVQCAVQSGVKVQPKSGGHSFSNFGFGGQDGHLVIDLVQLDSFSIDEQTWHASFGSGLTVGQLDKHLQENGGRAIAHGTCPGVGVGGHATIGGLGPMSGMWGSMLDHIIEVEVVTANGDIQQANLTHNADLFWALRGAASSFGIISKFVAKTYQPPASVIDYTYTYEFANAQDMGRAYTEWQAIISDPSIDRRFSSIFIAAPLKAYITGSFYGSETEFHKLQEVVNIPAGGELQLLNNTWAGSTEYWAHTSASLLDSPTHFVSKSLGFRQQDLLQKAGIEDIFEFISQREFSPMFWVIVFDFQGPGVTEVHDNDSSYPHRDKVMFYQSYGFFEPNKSEPVRQLIDGVHERIQQHSPLATTTYAGYVDGCLSRKAGQELYWGPKMTELRRIKQKWDFGDVFNNPQSVDPFV